MDAWLLCGISSHVQENSCYLATVLALFEFVYEYLQSTEESSTQSTVTSDGLILHRLPLSSIIHLFKFARGNSVFFDRLFTRAYRPLFVFSNDVPTLKTIVVMLGSFHLLRILGSHFWWFCSKCLVLSPVTFQLRLTKYLLKMVPLSCWWVSCDPFFSTYVMWTVDLLKYGCDGHKTFYARCQTLRILGNMMYQNQWCQDQVQPF